jgi:hypothetical protein
MRPLAIALLCAAALFAQKYGGPLPPKADVPYLVHADNLVETEAAEAREQQKRDDILYTVAGANSAVKTPLASPVFLLLSEKLDPARLQLYKLESRNNQREILFRKRRGSVRPIRFSVTRLSATGNLYRLEVDESLENGEYTLTPEGSNDVFCFQVY